MCGIVGYIGFQKASPILLAGLSKLEYRGYDSAGIATIEGNKIAISKDKGRVENLYNLDETKNLEGSIGIAHTRWATHGIPSKINSHPHMDNSNSFAVVHNGIIENYIELKKFLEEKGYNFISDTDTEVIPNLINYYYKRDLINDDLKLLRAVKLACNELIGSFSLEILSVYMPNNMIVVRKDSPLVIGKGNGENYIASDIPAILSYTKNFYLLENFEYAVLSKDNIKFYDNDLKEFEKTTTTITWDAMAADKSGFDDYMIKEIMEQPTKVRETIGSRLDNDTCNFDELGFSKEYLSSLHQIYIIACGTAMHVGLCVKNTIENLCKIHTEVDIASEFRYRNPLINDKTLCIFISQSGETADTLAALKLCKSKHAKTIAVTNVTRKLYCKRSRFCTLYTCWPRNSCCFNKGIYITNNINYITCYLFCRNIRNIYF
jgi:glucosamine--fructose-6-phosphate aminotransferase (isomerizing)